MDFLIIGNPENRRVAFFQNALKAQGMQPATILPYEALLSAPMKILPHLKKNSILRLESPGENFLVERELIAMGEGWISSKGARELMYEKGRIYYPAQWFDGFTKFLTTLSKIVDESGKDVLWMNHPDDILSMFHKPSCQELLRRNNIPVPKPLPSIKSYEDLRSLMEKEGSPRVFVKLASSSSASGVVAYQYHPVTKKEIATTTMELVRNQGKSALYNSLRIKTYTQGKDIKEILDWMMSEGAHIEVWMPKALHERKAFDIRMVVINGKAAHKICRLSHSPMTNLHLGNERKSFYDIVKDKDTQVNLMDTAKRAAAVFKKSLYTGIDVLPCGKSHRPYIVDVNAFGDLLPGCMASNGAERNDQPGCMASNGADTYTFEIQELINKWKNGEYLAGHE